MPFPCMYRNYFISEKIGFKVGKMGKHFSATFNVKGTIGDVEGVRHNFHPIISIVEET